LNGGLELMVPPFQLTSLLHDVYFACEKLGHFNQDADYQLDRVTGLLANFFWNVYDPWVILLPSESYVCNTLFLQLGNAGIPYPCWRSRSPS